MPCVGGLTASLPVYVGRMCCIAVSWSVWPSLQHLRCQRCQGRQQHDRLSAICVCTEQFLKQQHRWLVELLLLHRCCQQAFENTMPWTSSNRCEGFAHPREADFWFSAVYLSKGWSAASKIAATLVALWLGALWCDAVFVKCCALCPVLQQAFVQGSARARGVCAQCA